MLSPSAALLISSTLYAAGVQSQSYTPGDRSDDAFSYVQPENTTILGQYGHSPAVLPSPNTTVIDGWEDAFAKAQDFVSQLTAEEKADMVTGQPGPCVGNILPIPRLGFKGLCLHDGPLAIRVADYASVFSAGVSVASTWDKDIMYERGYAIGQEFKDKGAHVALSPCAGPLGRSAFSGRNWEGFSPDPYLSGEAMGLTVQGHQDAGVQATAKHFIANEQETQRNPVYNSSAADPQTVIQEALSSNLDDRTMHELYLWPFANAVRHQVASIMCAYQRVNGSYACQNSKLLNGILKEELGFHGYVMSDWGGTHSGVASIESGLDMDMPGGIGMYGLSLRGEASDFGGNVTSAVSNGTVEESRVDDMIVRIMAPYYFLGQDNEDFPSVDASSADLNTFSPRNTWKYDWEFTGESSRDVRRDHGDLIRKHGAAGTILLKNVNGTLPLKAPKSLAVFGNDASEPTQGLLNQANYEYGTLVAGGGSGTGRLTYLVTPLAAIKERAAQDDAYVQQWLNNTLIASSDITTLWNPTPPDVCIVLLKTWAEEAADRESLHVDWDGDDVVESVASKCNNTVVVTHSSGINMLPWADHPNVTAILAAHFPGQESGNSLVDILYGEVNPSGHLPYTIALNDTDYNAPPTTNVSTDGADDWQSWFDERLEIDYRYFDSHDIPVRYEFGFGLSYTTFDLGEEMLLVHSTGDLPARPPAQPTAPGGNPALWEMALNVTVEVQNTGDRDGHAVPQVYLTFPASVPDTPPKQLRGFEKVHVAAGENEPVTFSLMRRDVSYWDIVQQEWIIPSGEFLVNVGFSSRDIKKCGGVTLIEG